MQMRLNELTSGSHLRLWASQVRPFWEQVCQQLAKVNLTVIRITGGRVPNLARMNAELLGMFALLLAIDHGLLAGRAFEGLEPNPYWLPVLIMTVGYGGGMGLAAAFLASMIWIITPHPSQTGDHFEQVLSLSILPMLWVTVAIAAGELTTSRLEKVKELQRRERQRNNELQTLAESLEQIAQTNRSLQVRIANDDRTVGKAITAAVDLLENNPKKQIYGVERMIAMATQCEDFTYYSLIGNHFNARFFGREATDRTDALALIDLDQVPTQSPKSLSCSADNAYQLQSGALVIPVFNDDEDALAGALVIGDLPELLQTESKLAELSQISQALGRLSDLMPIAKSRHRDKAWLLQGTA